MKEQPCPFCGSDAITMDRARDVHGDHYFAFCNACEASGPTDYDEDRAWELWNDRRSE